MYSQEYSSYSPLVSIVIPARNEAKDIAATLEACLAIEYGPKEIIVVDDSTDETPQIVGQYAERGVRLIHRSQNRNGCCGARNLGMQSAEGEIIVLMNADDRPHPDFIQRILPHYHGDIDFVLVRSQVANFENLWGKYIHVTSEFDRNIHPDPSWSEGISVRKSAVQAIGYIPGDFPIPFCRDNLLGRRLVEAGYKKLIDLSIPMLHVTPDNLVDYWHNQVWRGSFSAPYAYYFRGLSIPHIIIRELLKATRTVLLNIFILPKLWRVLRQSRYSINKWRDIPGLLWVSIVQDAAIISGNIKGLFQLINIKGSPIKG